ncbi:hypothetical protein AB5I41_29105 [Sphingomonas sp. MMS24-JH45]
MAGIGAHQVHGSGIQHDQVQAHDARRRSARRHWRSPPAGGRHRLAGRGHDRAARADPGGVAHSDPDARFVARHGGGELPDHHGQRAADQRRHHHRPDRHLSRLHPAGALHRDDDAAAPGGGRSIVSRTASTSAPMPGPAAAGMP